MTKPIEEWIVKFLNEKDKKPQLTICQLDALRQALKPPVIKRGEAA